MNAKTAGILLAAGGLVAAAVILDQRTASSASADPEPDTPTTPIAANHCEDGDAPARDRADFGPGAMTAALSGSKLLRGGAGEVFMAAGIDVGEIDVDAGQALSLAIVIDRSGSMHGEPLDRAKRAALGIAERLSAKDRVALVQYDHEAQVVVPSTPMNAVGRARLREAIQGITPGGNTNLHGGMMLGREEVVREVDPGALSRVVLLSDGRANAGLTEPRAVARDAALAADQGVRITTIGLGIHYNEDLMEAIAESGLGNYYYVRDAAALAEVFAGELDNLQATVATGAELKIEPLCEGVEIEEVFGYQTRRDGPSVAIPLADIAGGDSRKLVVRLNAPAGVEGRQNLVRATLAYEDAREGGERAVSVDLGIDVTSDAAAVSRSTDKDVVAQVLEVETARAMREAADAYDRGDVAAARDSLRRGRAEAERQAEKFELEAEQAAPALDRLGGMEDDVQRYAPSSTGGRAAVKGAKQNARDLVKQNH